MATSSWALRRQLLLLLIPFFLFIFLGYEIYSHYVYRAPTCTDGTQNGNETGVDCGGSCSLVCSQQSISPVLLWAHAFQVSGTVYNAVAYVQNPNNSSRAKKVPYEFRLFNTTGLLVATRQGSIDIAPGKTFAIFEGGIQISGSNVARTDFAFNHLSTLPPGSVPPRIVWTKDTSREPVPTITHGTLENASATPYLSGTITNSNLMPMGSTELVVFIVDDRGNTIDVSKTIVDPLAPRASAPFVFTWQRPIPLASSTVIQIFSRAL